jgi:hypothetical protein
MTATLEELDAVRIARAIYRVPVSRRMRVLALALQILIAGDLLVENAPITRRRKGHLR